MPRPSGPLLVAASGVSFGAMAVLARFAYAAGADPLTALALRFGIAAVVLGAVLAIRRTPLPRGRLLASLAVMGGVGLVAESLVFFTALTMASAGLVSLLLYLYPALVTALTAIAVRRWPGRRRLVALGLALLGTALTVGPSSATARPLGIVLGIASALIFAAYLLVGARLTASAGALAATWVNLAAAALVFAALAAARGPQLPAGAGGWVAILGLALISTVCAYGFLFAGLRRIDPAPAAMISTLEPVVTVVLAALFLGETLGPLQYVGGALIVGAALLLAREGQRSGPTAAPGKARDEAWKG